MYQRLDKAKTMSELNSLKAEFDDYYGNLPEAILTLIEKRKLEILSHYSIIEDIKEKLDNYEELSDEDIDTIIKVLSSLKKHEK